MSFGAASVVTFFTLDAQGEKSQAFRLADNDARQFLQLVNFATPLKPGGLPGALVTGILAITFTEDRGAASERQFCIYNNELLQDLSFPDTYYRAAPEFASAVYVLRR